MYIPTETVSLDWLRGIYIRTETYSLDWLCVIYIRTEMFFWDSPCGMYIPTEMIFSDYRVGCTYLQKWFSRITVWDVHTYENDFLGLPCGMYIHTKMIGFRCLARSHTAPAWVPGRPIPDDFWVVWEGHPIAHTHLATVPNAVAERGKKPKV